MGPGDWVDWRDDVSGMSYDVEGIMEAYAWTEYYVGCAEWGETIGQEETRSFAIAMAKEAGWKDVVVNGRTLTLCPECRAEYEKGA